MDTNDYIVTFIDILGYKDLIDKSLHDFENESEKIKKSFEEIHENFEELKLIPHRLNIIHKTIDLKSLSDSIIITMPISNLSKIHDTYDNNMNLFTYIFIYLHFVALTYREVASKIGCLTRGAIVKGLHRMENIGETKNLFLFSPAVTKAYQLEKKTIYPRIVIDDGINEYINNIVIDKSKKIYKDMMDLINIDHTGVRVLNFYPKLITQLDANNIYLKIQLLSIKDKIDLQISKNRTSPHIIDKYNYFSIIHNKKVLKKPDYKIYEIRIDGKPTSGKLHF